MSGEVPSQRQESKTIGESLLKMGKDFLHYTPRFALNAIKNYPFTITFTAISLVGLDELALSIVGVLGVDSFDRHVHGERGFLIYTIAFFGLANPSFFFETIHNLGKERINYPNYPH